MLASREEEAMKDATGIIKYSYPPLIPQPQPWLVAFHGKQHQKQTFYSISERRCHVRTIPELRNKTSRASLNEWLILEDLVSHEFSLFNLLSKEIIQLPSIEDVDPDICILTYPPSNSECLVVFLYGDSSTLSLSLWYCKPGDTEFCFETFCINDYFSHAIAFKRSIYVVTRFKSYLYVVNFTTGQRRPEFTPQIDKPFQGKRPLDIIYSTCCLIESCQGELLFVHKMVYGHHVQQAFAFAVYKFDSSNKSWIEVKSIGKEHAIFLNPVDSCMIQCSSATEESSGLIKGNSIYFTEYQNRSLYLFDLENKTISFSQPCTVARDPDYSWINYTPI